MHVKDRYVNVTVALRTCEHSEVTSCDLKTLVANMQGH